MTESVSNVARSLNDNHVIIVVFFWGGRGMVFECFLTLTSASNPVFVESKKHSKHLIDVFTL